MRASPAKARGIPAFQLRHSPSSGLCFQYHTVYRTRHLSPLLVAMAQTPPSASSSSNFQAILYSSLKTYEKKTKQDILTHPLMAQLQTCNSPTDILTVLRTQIQQFEQSTSDDDKLTRWLNPTVNVLYAFSSALGAGVGLVPIEQSFYDLSSDIIFLGILSRECDIFRCRRPPLGNHRLVLPYSDISDTERIQAAKDTLASQGALVDIFGRIENFFRRLETYTEVPTTEAMKDIIVKIMVEVLGIFAIVTKELKQGRASELIRDTTLPVADRNSEKYMKKLIGRKDIEDALSRLDRLTQEEARMATAQVMKVAHLVKDGVEAVRNKVNLAVEGTFGMSATHT